MLNLSQFIESGTCHKVGICYTLMGLFVISLGLGGIAGWAGVVCLLINETFPWFTVAQICGAISLPSFIGLYSIIGQVERWMDMQRLLGSPTSLDEILDLVRKA